MQENNYDDVMEKQAEMIRRRGSTKRKSLIAKDKQYFDSTELSKVLAQAKLNQNVEQKTN